MSIGIIIVKVHKISIQRKQFSHEFNLTLESQRMRMAVFLGTVLSGKLLTIK